MTPFAHLTALALRQRADAIKIAGAYILSSESRELSAAERELLAELDSPELVPLTDEEIQSICHG